MRWACGSAMWELGFATAMHKREGKGCLLVQVGLGIPASPGPLRKQCRHCGIVAHARLGTRAWSSNGIGYPLAHRIWAPVRGAWREGPWFKRARTAPAKQSKAKPPGNRGGLAGPGDGCIGEVEHLPAHSHSACAFQIYASSCSREAQFWLACVCVLSLGRASPLSTLLTSNP